MAHEDIVIGPNIRIDTASRVVEAIEQEFGGAQVLTTHFYGREMLVIRVDVPDTGPQVRPARSAS